ncbi:MAG: S-layer homology domain-containing protein [Anaerovoracaceae bacterium]
MKKRWIGIILSVLMVFTGLMPGQLLTAAAKTQSSSAAENVFFYASDGGGSAVLMKVIPVAELEKLAHGQTGADGSVHNYYISTTDNYPTTQYCEARGFTLPELVEYVASVSSAQGADGLHYTGSDVMKFMATDSYGNYTHSWSWNELYGQKRYYFEGLFDEEKGWNSGWEVGTEDNAKYGLTMEEYTGRYQAADAYYDAKRAVFEGGEETEVILATESYSGRTTSNSLTASTEIGLADYISANGGVVGGCLSDVLEKTWSLRLCLPMTETDLMTGHRTAYDNFKWVYCLQLDMAGTAAGQGIVSKGTVAAPEASYAVSADGKKLTVSLSCATPGASIYYSLADAPQTLYTGPVTVDISGRDLSANPVTVYMTAVKEGYDDAGIITSRYPQSGVRFKTIYNAMTGSDVVLEAEADVSATEWNSWTAAFISVNMKAPSGTGYAALDRSEYRVDSGAKTITMDKSLFGEAGSYSFAFYAKGFANKNVSVSVKKGAPQVTSASADMTGGIVLSFDDTAYQTGAYVYLVEGDGKTTVLLPSSALDRSQPGKLIIRPDYFTAASSKISGAGDYLLEIVNNSYAPAAQRIQVTLEEGAGAPGNPDLSGTAKFTDVADSAWYRDAVDFVVARGYFAGTGNGAFSPGSSMTRGMFVTVLGRMAGAEVSSETGSSFADVAAGKYYTGYVEWACKNSIVSGVGGGRFDPDGSITREQMAVILYNYAKASGEELGAADTGGLDAFSDGARVSSWASDAVNWAVSRGILKGSGGQLMPQGQATRAQVAQIIMNYTL